MTRVTWHDPGSHMVEGGVDQGVLYVEGAYGVPWNGLTQVTEKPTGADVTAYYLDGQKYYTGMSSEEFSGTIEAYYSPPEFDACDGSLTLGLGLYARQQRRKSFGMSYRTLIGNDTEGQDYGYKLHLIYNALASPSQHSYTSISQTFEPATLSWDVTATEILVPGGAPTAHIIIDMTEAHPELRIAVEDILYGTDTDQPRLPLPEELIELFESTQYLVVTDNGDGTATITSSDDIVFQPDPDNNPDEWTITYPSVIPVASDTYQISSL